MTREMAVLMGGLFFGLTFGFLCLMAWKVLNTIQMIAGNVSRSGDHERRDLLQYTERLWEKREFSQNPTVTQAHAAERIEKVRSDADVDKVALQADLPKPKANEQSDLVNTGPDPAAML